MITTNFLGQRGTPTLVPIVDDTYDQQDFEDVIHVLPAGSVFTFEGISFETMAARLIRSINPEERRFRFVYLAPGTNAYAIYGANHAMVTENVVLTPPV